MGLSPNGDFEAGGLDNMVLAALSRKSRVSLFTAPDVDVLVRRSLRGSLLALNKMETYKQPYGQGETKGCLLHEFERRGLLEVTNKIY